MAIRRQRLSNLEQVNQVYLDLESQDRLGELVDTGLSVDEARAVVAEEKANIITSKLHLYFVPKVMTGGIRSTKDTIFGVFKL